MPFRNYTQFDSAALKAMTTAYDAVVARLRLKSDDPLTGKLAAKIANLAEGQRDVGKLTEEKYEAEVARTACEIIAGRRVAASVPRG